MVDVNECKWCVCVSHRAAATYANWMSKKWNVIETFHLECEFRSKIDAIIWILFSFSENERISVHQVCDNRRKKTNPTAHFAALNIWIGCRWLHATNVQPQMGAIYKWLEQLVWCCLLGHFQPNELQVIFNGTMLIMPISLLHNSVAWIRVAIRLDWTIFSKQTKVTTTTPRESKNKTNTHNRNRIAIFLKTMNERRRRRSSEKKLFAFSDMARYSLFIALPHI